MTTTIFLWSSQLNAAPCHLKDVTMMSPGLKLPRGAGGDSSSGKAKAGVTVGQYSVMKAERENAIWWYL